MRCKECGHETTATDYVGKLVFVEAHRGTKSDREYSNYYGGEYLIIRQTPSVLYGVKFHCADECYAREIRQLPLVGESRYDILQSSIPNRADVEAHVRQLWHNAHKPERGEKLQWVGTVYAEGKATAKQMASILGIALPEIVAAAPSDLTQRLERLESGFQSLIEKLKKIGESLR